MLHDRSWDCSGEACVSDMVCRPLFSLTIGRMSAFSMQTLIAVTLSAAFLADREVSRMVTKGLCLCKLAGNN